MGDFVKEVIDFELTPGFAIGVMSAVVDEKLFAGVFWAAAVKEFDDAEFFCSGRHCGNQSGMSWAECFSFTCVFFLR